MSTGLKKCPFCQSSLLFIDYLLPYWGEDEKVAMVICQDCSASAPLHIWRHSGDMGASVFQDQNV